MRKASNPHEKGPPAAKSMCYLQSFRECHNFSIMPKYDVSAFIAACDIHKISMDSDEAKAVRDIISHDTDKLLAVATSYRDIILRAAAVKAKTSPAKDVAVAKEKSITEKKVEKPEDDGSCGTPEKSDKPKREIMRFSDAEWDFAKTLYPKEWGVSEIPRSASKFATSVKDKAHIKCAQSLKFSEDGVAAEEPQGSLPREGICRE